MSFRLAWASETLSQKLNWMERLRSSPELVFEGDDSARSREKYPNQAGQQISW